MLCGVLIVPVSVWGYFALSAVAYLLHLDSLMHHALTAWLFMGVVLCLAATVARRGIARGWNTPVTLRNSWIVAVVLLLFTLATLANAWGARARPRSVHRAVLANARLLATAADQYFLDHNVTHCTYSDLVGTDKYVKVIHKVMDETYPPSYAKAGVITITGVAGARTITYAP